MRRSVFGAYVQELLREAIARQDGGDNLFLVTDEATAIRPADGGYRLETANGRTYSIDAAVFALGNAAEPKQSIRASSRIRDLLRPRHRSEPGRPVVVLGTGLTMVDVCLALTEQGFEGPITRFPGAASCRSAMRPPSPWEGLELDAATVAPCWRCSGQSAARFAGPARARSAGGP